MHRDLPKSKTYLPAAGKDWLLPLYDPLTYLFGLDSFYYRLLERVPMLPYQKVLDIGCGTGSLGKVMKQIIPSVEFTGTDPDPKALSIAKRKLKKHANVHLDVGFCDNLPYAHASFDHVVSTFVFHHLVPGKQIEMCNEAKRVLRPGGTFYAVDFDTTSTSRAFADLSVRDILHTTGFQTVEVERKKYFPFGSVLQYYAIKPVYI